MMPNGEIREAIREAERAVTEGHKLPAEMARELIARFGAGNVRRTCPEYFYHPGPTEKVLAQMLKIHVIICTGHLPHRARRP